MGLCAVSVTAEAACPPLPEVPVRSSHDLEAGGSWDGFAAPRSIVEAYGGYDDAPFGIGHLRVENASDHFYDWPLKILLPVWERPEGTFRAWIYAGTVHPVDGRSARRLSGAGAVETGYEHQTFIVFETSGDGWLRIRLGHGESDEAWTHVCHLGLGAAKLAYQSWEAMLDERGEWLHFRARVPHALRAAPGERARRITWIGLDHELTLLERVGDWLRVRVRQPAWTCAGPEQAFKGRIDVGWVKWRDDDKGPWVWYYTRGC